MFFSSLALSERTRTFRSLCLLCTQIQCAMIFSCRVHACWKKQANDDGKARKKNEEEKSIFIEKL
jgi:hypothetical protein